MRQWFNPSTKSWRISIDTCHFGCTRHPRTRRASIVCPEPVAIHTFLFLNQRPVFWRMALICLARSFSPNLQCGGVTEYQLKIQTTDGTIWLVDNIHASMDCRSIFSLGDEVGFFSVWKLRTQQGQVRPAFRLNQHALYKRSED